MSDYRWGEVVGILKVDKFGFCLLLLVGVCSRRMVDAIVGFSSPCWDALSFCLRGIVDYTRHLLVKLLLHSGPSPDNDDDNDDPYNDDDNGGGNLCDLMFYGQKPGQPLHKLAVISQCILRVLHHPCSSSILCVPVHIMIILKLLLLLVVVVHPHEALLDLLHGDGIRRHVQVRVQLAVVRQQEGVKSLGGLRQAGRIWLGWDHWIC